MRGAAGQARPGGLTDRDRNAILAWGNAGTADRWTLTTKTHERSLRRILVGTDFSNLARHAVVRAALLAAEHHARLELLHVTPRLDRAVLRRFGLDRLLGHRPEAELRRQLAEAVELARTHGAHATARLTRGGAAVRLAEEAERRNVDLIVVGARGDRSFKHELLGTTAERLIERSMRDVLVVRGAPKSAYRHLLLCTALGPASSAVVRAGVALSAGARLHLLHVYEPPFEVKLVVHGAGAKALAAHRDATHREAERALSALVERCDLPAARAPALVLRQGRAAHEILVAARNAGADAIVVGKNQSVLQELFLGSATKHVVRSTARDVLIVAPR